MGDYYHHFLSSMSGAGMNPVTTPEEMFVPHMHGQPIPIPSAPVPGPYQQLGYFTGFPEPMMFNPSKPQKNRRKSGPATGTGMDHCDENRPICERCKKGNRECVYPEPPNSKGSSGSGKSKDPAAGTQTSPSSSTADDDEDTEQDSKLETIPDEDEPEDPAQKISKASKSLGNMPPRRQTSEAPSQANFQRCLAHFVDNMTNFHYCIPHDSDEFFKTIFPSAALRHEPLLNALVGFSAYHLTLQDPNGKLQDFLQYYNRSVTLLLGTLKRKEKHTVATLLTILQLATIEEYLGDWVNLMGHQKAAFEILTSMFTPQTIMQTPMGRMCLQWYARFDSFIALMGGFPTDLPREWFTAMVEFHQSQVITYPEEMRWRIEEWSARLRLISYDMSILFARGSRGQITPEQFAVEHDQMTNLLVEWKETRDPALSDTRYLVTEFPTPRPSDPDDIVDPYTPGILYEYPLFTTTILCAEWNSIMIMHKCQSSTMPPEMLFAELGQHAYMACQYFESLEYWPFTPKGVLILTQASIAIAALFLPQDARHHMWFRRKFALLETMGYIHPISLRTKMAEMFRDPSCSQWWLPNGERFSPVLQSIRSFADERNAAAVTAQQENLREVRHIFAKLSMNEQDSGSSTMGEGPAT
ncbi:hypothetical protein G7Z17_g8396 [Cylindrodendrum hubeiense]|uniref:Zn(2)-C6 fungal-type domain-containing protein n=1 Tax=Cylindrodendrum hubeiense TaxID=595255 RepID=A0A9P5HBA9_9HYPO|nr:hypothetical protein G7Z17_g8396 [Cylindrodendrum hubeiense]